MIDNENVISPEEIYGEDLKNLSKEFDEAKARMIEKSKDAFKAAMNKYFTQFPEVVGIVWSQYTPWFNDGEACTFSVGEAYAVTQKILEELELNNVHQLGCPYEIGEAEAHEYNSLSNKHLSYIFRNIPDESLESAFGDHALIIMDREKINVEEYSHD